MGKAEVTSVYVGGGTPTLALPSIARILTRVRERFSLTGDIAVETNPADVDADVIAQLHEAGVSLVSLGVESLRAEHLAAIGRGYTLRPPCAP
jgi:oxygen-independent coproporphyrinogen-3 oxidase